jgi:hypothetical protein
LVKVGSLAFAIAAVVITAVATCVRGGAHPSSPLISGRAFKLASSECRKSNIDATHRHREWVNLPLGGAVVRAFLVYPERSDRAPVVIVNGTEGASDWVRAVADQLAAGRNCAAQFQRSAVRCSNSSAVARPLV